MRLPLFIITVAGFLFAQGDPPPLEQYIRDGLRTNLQILQQQAGVNEQVAKSSEAGGLYLPTADFTFSYARAEGGRKIAVNAGDLVNPVLDAINLTRIQSGLNPLDFPVVENESIPFLLKEEYKSYIRVIQPLYNRAISNNYKAQKRFEEVTRLQLNTVKREIVAKIKGAWYNIHKADQAVIIYRRSAEVLAENLRVTRSLLANDKITRDAVYRAEAELSANAQALLEVENQSHIARSWFNTLLNRPLETPVVTDSTLINANISMVDNLEIAQNRALEQRDELRQLDLAIDASDYARKAETAGLWPNLALVGDLGYQSQDVGVEGDETYYYIAAQLQWNLFRGGRDVAKNEQYKNRIAVLQARRQEVRNQIMLDVETQWREVKLQKQVLSSAKDRKRSALASFNLVNKRYKSGIANPLEFLDARVSATRATLGEAIARFNLMIAAAQLERATAAFNINILTEGGK